MTTVSIPYDSILLMEKTAEKLRCACNLSDAFLDDKTNRRNLRSIITNVRQMASLTPSSKGMLVLDKRTLQKVSKVCDTIDYDHAAQLNQIIKGALA